MASDDLKRIVAAEVALGARTGELADRFGYTSRGMRKLVHSPEVQQIVAEERQALAEEVDRYRAQLVGMGDRALERIRATLEDPRHPKAVETARWLLDRVAFGRGEAPQIQVNVDAHLNQQVVSLLNEKVPGIARSLEGYSDAPIEQDPRLISPPTR